MREKFVQTASPESERYLELSRHFIEKADEYLAAGDAVQASEKAWGAVAEAFKSIAEERGWSHKGHRILDDVAFQLSLEWQRQDVKLTYDALEKLHINFYEDSMELDEIAASIGNAKTLLDELETLRTLPTRPVILNSRERRLRWRRLTGELLPRGADTGAPGSSG